jgi:hypothetical protein
MPRRHTAFRMVTKAASGFAGSTEQHPQDLARSPKLGILWEGPFQVFAAIGFSGQESQSKSIFQIPSRTTCPNHLIDPDGWDPILNFTVRLHFYTYGRSGWLVLRKLKANWSWLDGGCKVRMRRRQESWKSAPGCFAALRLSLLGSRSHR